MSLHRVHLFNVSPFIPKELRFLEVMSQNLWWSWHFEAIELFQRIDPHVWWETRHNPMAFLARIPQERLEALAHDEGFLSHQEQVAQHFEAQTRLSGKPNETGAACACIAYFSLEYGIHESLRLYSGGLGVLAGDHMKAASDMDLPLVGVGLMYQRGYATQYLNPDGWQQEHYPDNEIHMLPVKRACDTHGTPVQVSLDLSDGKLIATVWRLDVGRVPIFLLDTNLPENPAALRQTTAQLYATDRTIRLRQEILLGIGGFQALVALGYEPKVCHLNEGHAAFLVLGRLSHLLKTQGIDLAAAKEVVRRTSVFTTHTPVPAGNETFPVDIVRNEMRALSGHLGLDAEDILSLGRPANDPNHHEFSMTVLGLRMAAYTNGVSALHGQVARRMWKHLWPGRPVDEVPISHVTNGIHVPSWISTDLARLYDLYLGPKWHRHPGAAGVLSHVDYIPNEELWHAHGLGRSRLVRTARDLAERQLCARNATRTEIEQVQAALDLNVLTIGFARRFATYKRAALILRDQERLEKLLLDERRPVQIIFAGKAHPADNEGKDLIRRIIHFARRPEVRARILFIENYDIHMARSLVQGVDVWLNTPRRPLEASGTSGMKAAVNGALHLSTLDGWWAEGYAEGNGWAIGEGREYDDPEYQDAVEAQALYNLLEDEVIPAFYDRSKGGVPETWAKMMKAAIKMSLSFFSSHRMVAEYRTRFYDPAMKEYDELLKDQAARTRTLADEYRRLQAMWHAVRVELPSSDRDIAVVHVGDTFTATTRVHLGELKPEEVEVQVYYGPVDAQNEITESHADKMDVVEDQGHGTYVCRQQVVCRSTGRFGFSARAIPARADWRNIMPGFITWADGVSS